MVCRRSTRETSRFKLHAACKHSFQAVLRIPCLTGCRDPTIMDLNQGHVDEAGDVDLSMVGVGV